MRNLPICLVPLFGLFPCLGYTTPLVYVDFESSPNGEYYEDSLEADWPDTFIFHGIDEDAGNGIDEGRVSVVADPILGSANKVIAVEYPAAGATDGSGPSESGASWLVNLSGTHNELWVQYDVFFPAGFDFGRGGKLPGLTGGSRPTGNNVADGTNGFSNRMMWRSQTAADPRDATAPIGSANVIFYTHHPDSPTSTHEDFNWTDPSSTYVNPETGAQDQWLQITTGTWHTITQQVVLNTPGVNDGIIRGWWDGTLMSEETNMRFRDVSSFDIDHFYFTTFFGGSDSSWAPQTDQTAYFDNITVSPTPLQSIGEADVINLSTRGYVGTGDNVLIGGLIIQGSGTKKVMITGRGPSIPSSVPGRLADPRLSIYSGSTVIASSDNWASESQQAQITNTSSSGGPGGPGSNLDAAIILDLSPGAYTAIVSGTGGGTGIGIVEIFDLEPNSTARLVNLSTRGYVGTGDNVLIGGVIIAGTTSATEQLVFTGRGPSIPSSVPGRLADPTITLYNSAGPFLTVDDWASGASATELSTSPLSSYAPSNGLDAATVNVLSPAPYTAILQGSGGNTGIGIVEIFITNP